eukprot:350380-Chlamydomonas_euryale.AAC.5
MSTARGPRRPGSLHLLATSLRAGSCVLCHRTGEITAYGNTAIGGHGVRVVARGCCNSNVLVTCVGPAPHNLPLYGRATWIFGTLGGLVPIISGSRNAIAEG